MRRWLPDRMGARFALLLTAALLSANLVALVLLSVERDRLGRTARIEREAERAASLVPVLEAAPPEARRAIARRASTRVTRLAVETRPRLKRTGNGPRSRALAEALEAALPGRDVRAAVLAGRGGSGAGRGAAQGIVASVALDAPGRNGSWLNLVARAAPGGPPPLPAGVLALVLGLGLAAVLTASLLASRQMTRPLGALARAARAAGQGDRSARVPEAGPREVREAAAAFNDMQARIARFDAERIRTLAALGHDLRTPITSLRLRAEMLAADPYDGGDLHDRSDPQGRSDPHGGGGPHAGDAPLGKDGEDGIEEEAQAMIRTLDEMTVMADGLVAYARGQGDGEAAASTDLAAWLRRLCVERGASVGTLPPAVALVRPVALSRAVGNLIDNALRYAGAAHVTLARHGADVVIAVEDDGPGIPPERLADVQEPFVRGEGSRTDRTGGAGLGLAIARAVAQAHGGRLVLANRAEGGLRAKIRLPVGDGDAA